MEGGEADRGPLRAAIYVRVSSRVQAKRRYSLDAQLTLCRAYCEDKGWRVVAEYEEGGRSAYNPTLKRPRYNQMMNERDRWDVIVVSRMDRIWRHVEHFNRMIEDLRAWGKSITFIQDGIDAFTSEGRFVADIVQRIAQAETKRTSEWIKAAYDQKWASRPDSWFGRAPDGYRRVDGLLVIDDRQVPNVRRIFELALQGKTIKEITCLAGGMTGPRGGKYTSTARINFLLRDPAYAGYAYHNGVIRPNSHPPIVTEEEFNKVQVAIFVRTRMHPRLPLILRGEPIRVRPVKQGSHPRARQILYATERPGGLEEMVTAYLRESGRSLARRDALLKQILTPNIPQEHAAANTRRSVGIGAL